MQTVTASRNPIDRAELPSMLATLCSYENWFGPYHPQTLCLMAQVAFAYCQAREFDYARPLLERAIRDLGRHVCRDHELRLRAIAILKDFFVAQGDYERAEAFQRELLECHVQRLGSDHPETLDTRSSLAMVLLDRATCDSNREV